MMKNPLIVLATLLAILCWAMSFFAANGESFSDGDTGRCVAHGTCGFANEVDDTFVESVTPAITPDPRPVPSPSNPRPANTQPGVSSTSPQVTVSVVTVGNDRYTVYDYDDLIARRCSFVIPEGLKTVRGLLVHGCYSGGDSRYDWKDCEYYRQFMHLHGFAYVGNTFVAGPLAGKLPQPADTSAIARHRAIFDSFVESVNVVAKASQHPEMVNAPFAGVGFSAGGGNALNLMCFAPDKTIAAASYCAPYLFKRRITGLPSDELLHVPAIAITGELEGFNVPLPADVDSAAGPARIDEVFLPYRPKGATYAWLERQGQGHAFFENRQDVLGMPFLDAAVRARYPADGDVTQGPIELIDLDPTTGWIVDNTSWKSGLTKIVPASKFTGDLGHSSWLMNEDLAFIYRAYSTYDSPLTITSPGNCWPTMPALEPGSNVPIIVDPSQFSDWKTITFYDGAKKLGEVAADTAPQFTVTDLTPGYHVFSILAADDNGNVRTADPKLVIVKPAKVASTTETSENSATPAAGEVSVLTTFPADRGPGYKMVPDTQGAVGPNHIVDFDGLNFVVHDKETGNVLVKKSQREFWASVEPANRLIAPNPWDPRFLYDATSGRWIGVIASDGHGLGFLAVSTSSDPTEPWKGVILPMEKQDLGFKLGVDKNGLYATYASAEQGRDTHTLHDCIAIPKEDLLAPGGPDLANLATFTRLEHDSFPATDLNPEKAPGDPLVILNKEFGDDCGQLYMYKITWQGKTASISDKQVIPLNRKYRSPNTTVEAATAPQPSPGITIRAPRRTIAVAQFGDSVYQCNNAKLDDTSPWGIFWCEVRVSDGELLQEGLVTDPNCDYLIPSLAVNKDGALGIGCTRTSATEFPSVYVTMRSSDDPLGTMRKPVLAVPGTTYFRVTNPHRFGAQFGNYSSTCIDPTNPGVFWTCQEYADSTKPDQWCTAWASFKLSK
ncbi:MAG: hypothetical protein U0996_10210 [Planctomycetaceae bacterium]